MPQTPAHHAPRESSVRVTALGRVNGPIPKSGSENQPVSLPFTAALVNFARAQLGREHKLLSPTTIAPLVLDAPIGYLNRSCLSEETAT